MKRVLTPEWLDELAAEEPAAVRSRRDLQRLNSLMGHIGTMSSVLAKAQGRGMRIVELGTGDGSFMLRLVQSPVRCGVSGHVVLVDRRPCISSATQIGFERIGWRMEVAAADVFDWLPTAAPAHVMVANLFLHHFAPKELARLLALAAEKCQLFVACEPRRGLAALTASRLLWVIGCNAVTRHDAIISVRAGFRDHELSNLWPAQGWNLREERAGLFSHLFEARKNEQRS